jgi:hypothetical protein
MTKPWQAVQSHSPSIRSSFLDPDDVNLMGKPATRKEFAAVAPVRPSYVQSPHCHTQQHCIEGAGQMSIEKRDVMFKGSAPPLGSRVRQY